MIIFLSLIIVCCLIFIFFIGKGYLTDAVKSKVTQKVAEQVFEKALESAGDPEAAEKAKQIVANMDEADKKQAEEIITKYADSETISDCMEIMQDGVNSESLGQVQQYLEQSVSQEDMQALWELYEKYGDSVQ
ncbi:MAG: hypothetical protein HFI48_06805 [Lachnospiraceae bacterium]|nr:hypothetical protein [Lachnospiraceae bacterium]